VSAYPEQFNGWRRFHRCELGAIVRDTHRTGPPRSAMASSSRATRRAESDASAARHRAHAFACEVIDYRETS
jgi:hypothetical protein